MQLNPPSHFPIVGTGEEAHSLAILLQERMEQLLQSYMAQVFAADITEVVQTREALRLAANEQPRLAVVVRDASDAIIVKDRKRRILAATTGRANPS